MAAFEHPGDRPDASEVRGKRIAGRPLVVTAMLRSTIATFALVSPFAPAHAAQQAPEGKAAGPAIPEIVVTAQKRAENVQNVPIAISVVDAEDLKVKGVDEMAELGTIVPGLHFSSSAAALLPRVRGVGSQIATAGNENSVATYVDGVYLAASSAALMSFNNIAQVAVLKGPQGTLFGRNATGGVIQITTLDPKDEFQGSASASYGNLETVEGAFYATGAIATNLAADLALYYRDQGEGFGKNLLTGTDVRLRKDFGARSKWRLSLAERTTFLLNGDYFKSSGRFGGKLPVDLDGRPLNGMSPFDLDHNIDPYQRVDQWGVAGTARHDLDGAELVSVTAYRRSKGLQSGDIDGTTIDFFNGQVSFDERQFTQEFNINSTGSGPFKWTAGAYYFHSYAIGGDLLIFPGEGATRNDSRQRTNSYSGFAQGTYDIGAETAITGGLRYTYENKRYLGAQDAFDAGTPILPPGPASAGKISNGALTWRLSLDHHLSLDVLGYASFSRGFKSAGFNVGRAAPPPETFRAEVLDAYEVGLKSSLAGGTVRFNAAAFYYDYKNIQINVFTDQPEPSISSGGPAEVYGVDADLTVVPVRGLTFKGGLSLNHSRFKNFPDAPISSYNPDSPLPVESGIGSATGNRLPLAPAWTADASIDYEAYLQRGGSLKFNVTYYHNDGFYGEADNQVRQRPYDLVNASATWFLTDDRRYSVKLWGKNLTDTGFATNVASFPTTYFKVVGDGRSFGITGEVHF